MHEWKETFEFNYNTGLYDLGTEHSPTTWIFEAGSFVPYGKITNGKHYSIITDHLGTPIEAYNQEGELIWEREQDLYGNSRQGFAKENFRCPFKYQGQYYDSEVELCYNRFRYYQPETGRYISEDPIKLLGGFNVFAYVGDTNASIDIFGLSSTYRLRDERGRFRRARTVEEELMVLGPLSGRRRRDIEKRLRQRGYTAVDARSGGKVWTKNMEDGNTVGVRIDPASGNDGFVDNRLHAHKEIVSSDKIIDGNYKPKHAKTFDDLGNQTSKNDWEANHIPIME